MKKVLSIILCGVIVVSCMCFSVNAKSVKVTTPKIKSVTATDTTTFKIKWSKVKGIKGYILYCKINGGKYKKLKTLSSNITSYKHKNLKNGKKYFYRIKAYKSVDGQNEYSNYSNQLAKKCTNYLVDIYRPIKSHGVEIYKGSEKFSFKFDTDDLYGSGAKYGNGIVLRNYDETYVKYDLNGKYQYISFKYGVIDGVVGTSTFSLVSDGEVIGYYEIDHEMPPKTIKVNIKNANILEFREDEGTFAGIANIKLYQKNKSSGTVGNVSYAEDGATATVIG